MTNTDRPEFFKTIAALGEVFNTETSDFVLELYFKALCDMDIEDFKAAATTLLQESKFFPKPAEFREIAKPKGIEALEAYQSVCRAVSRVGTYRSIQFADDPKAGKALELMGGWVAFGQSEQDEHWKQKEFLRIYDTLNGAELAPKTLQGVHHDETVQWFIRPQNGVNGRLLNP